MAKTIMYIHGYGSDGNAMKGQLLRKMLPQYRVVSPTFDYVHRTPWQIQDQIRETVEKEQVGAIVGSSFGGYHTLCALSFFRGMVWAVNPVHDVEETIRRVVLKNCASDAKRESEEFLNMYREFDRKVFRQVSDANRSHPAGIKAPINFALSTDDELLGDHRPLLELFPSHDRVVWKDRCGHRFLRFDELELL